MRMVGVTPGECRTATICGEVKEEGIEVTPCAVKNICDDQIGYQKGTLVLRNGYLGLFYETKMNDQSVIAAVLSAAVG